MTKGEISIESQNPTPAFDLLDMNNYKVEKLRKFKKVGFERWMELTGGPLAIISFIVIYYFSDIGFLNNINADILQESGIKRWKELGAEGFSKINYAIFSKSSLIHNLDFINFIQYILYLNI